MEFGNLIENELMTNSWMFEDAEPFKWVHKNTMNASLRTENIS